jgi:hypothetical protein
MLPVSVPHSRFDCQWHCRHSPLRQSNQILRVHQMTSPKISAFHRAHRIPISLHITGLVYNEVL